MKDYLCIGSSPYGEDCAQVGSDGYQTNSRKELIAYMGQLIRYHGEPPAGARVCIKSFPHDFGTYSEVCVEFDDTNEMAMGYAYRLEEYSPEHWDKQALQELGRI